jgi:glycosyltransferase involved in cell wall biosynthesis
MIETVEHPRFSSPNFASRHKKPGLSAIVRLRNEADFAETSLKSILPFFDEIVVVFNDCTDRTPEIVAEFARQNPDQVRAFHYGPRVFPQGSDQHRCLPANSVHSLVHYSNFALSKASYQVRCKWDGDHVAEPKSFERVVRQLRELKVGTWAWWLSPWRVGYWWYTGVNLWDHNGQIAVPQTQPMVGRRKDNGFWPAGRWIMFKHHPTFEYLFTRLLAPKFVGCLFFHLKGMKKDRGIGVYRLVENPQSPFVHRVERRWTNPTLKSFVEFRAAEPMAQSMPIPAELGIRPIIER